MKLQAFNSSYFYGKNCFGDDDSQIMMLVYYSTLNTLELKEDKGTDYVVGWTSKGLFKSKLLPLHGAFLPNIKYIGHKIGIQLKTLF